MAAIEIDPKEMWINYGQESIGTIKVENAVGEPDIVLTKTAEVEADAEESKGITGEAVKVMPKESTLYLMLITIIGILTYLIISLSNLKRKLSAKLKIL